MKINWLIYFLVLVNPCFTQITFRDSVSKEAINLVEIRDTKGKRLAIHQIGKKTDLSAYQNLELIAKHMDYRLKKFNAPDTVVYLNPYFQELKTVRAQPIAPLTVWDAIKRRTRDNYHPSDFYGKLKVKMQLSYLVKLNENESGDTITKWAEYEVWFQFSYASNRNSRNIDYFLPEGTIFLAKSNKLMKEPAGALPDLNDYTYFDVYEKQKRLSLFDKKAPYKITNCRTEQESHLRFQMESMKEPEEVRIYYDNQDSICRFIVGNIGFNQLKTNRSERRFRHVYDIQDSLYYTKMVETSFINFYLSDQQEILLTELHPGTLPQSTTFKALTPKEVIEALPVKELPYNEAPRLPVRYYELFKLK